MKFRTVLLSALVIFAGISASAKVIPPRPLFLDRDITVNGAEVPHGIYTLALESHGASVRATLSREGRFIATAHGLWVRHGIKYAQDAVLLRVNPDGTRSLTEIRLAGSAKTIVIEDGDTIPRRIPAPGGSEGKSSARSFS
jgi:hypothetical protein